MTLEVQITPYRPADEEELFTAARESIEAMYPWLPWCHPDYTRGDARRWIDFAREAFGAGREWHFGVRDASDGTLLGGCGLNRVQTDMRIANLGYWVRTSCSSRGVATAATRALAIWAFAHTELDRLEILAAVGNAASLRVAEKAGAVREGVLRSRLLLHGVRHDAVLYSLVRPGGSPPSSVPEGGGGVD